ncbi:MAG: hypothetical protein ABIX44_05895 [Cryobacterium sp.]
MTMSNRELIVAADAVLNPYAAGDRLFGDVGAALVTDRGNRYVGVRIDTEVILGATETRPLRELLPANEWPAPLDESALV